MCFNAALLKTYNSCGRSKMYFSFRVLLTGVFQWLVGLCTLRL